MTIKVIKLADALKRANEAAMQFADLEDRGTCNLDSTVIKLPHWKESDIREAERLSGVKIGDKLTGFWNGYRFVDTETHGQARLRTRMAEAAKRSLEESGFDVMMYYQMD